MSTKITSPNAMKHINAVKFNADGSRILSATSRRLSVIDAERGELVCSYDNCAYSGESRAPLASDPRNPYLAICGCTNGKGLIAFDLRKQKPAHFASNIHSSLIKDVIYLDESWPFGDGHQGTIVSVSLDGVCKVRTMDDRELHVFDVKHQSNCLTATPDVYSPASRLTNPPDYYDEIGDSFESIMMIGGNNLSAYIPGNKVVEPRLLNYGSMNERDEDEVINKLKYTSNGHLLYAITNTRTFHGQMSGGLVKRYRRFGNGHNYLGEVYSHNDEIMDMDLSPNDEYIVTGSRDGHVGLMCLGAPSFGWTGFMQLA